MALISDVTLPANAKYFGFIDKSKPVNTHWDITWSFTFAITGTGQHGFCTFLTKNPNTLSALPGHFLGYLGNEPYLLTEDYDNLSTEDKIFLTYDSPSLSSFTYDTVGVLGIAFDSTGYFALSNIEFIPGVGVGQINPNSLIIRNEDKEIVLNNPLSSMSTEFFLISSTKNYQTLRFRLTNSGKKIYIDFKKQNSTSYSPLTSLNIPRFNASVNDIVYVGFSFCSPLSSTSTDVSTMFLKNFTIEGLSASPTYEVVNSTPLYSEDLNYTTITNISAL